MSNQIRLAHRRADFQKPSRRPDTALVFHLAVYRELSTLRSGMVIALEGITILQMTQDMAVHQLKTGTDIAMVVAGNDRGCTSSPKVRSSFYGSRNQDAER
jgi:hypothetical protein